MLLERQVQGVERLACLVGIGGRQHQRAVGVLGHPDDARDIHLAFGQGIRDLGKCAGPILELDREPDGHTDTSHAAILPELFGPLAVRAMVPRGAARGRRLVAGAVLARCQPTARYHPCVAASGGTIQVFGLEGDRGTRAALRFFKERRAEISFVDLRRRPIAPGELRRFVEKLGAAALADTDGRAWRESGLGYLRMTDDELAGKLLANARLLKLPLVRNGADFSAGPSEATWKRWLLATTERGG